MSKSRLEWRAISVRQPWAWALVHGYKPIENRDWAPKPPYRGTLLIHAGKVLGCDPKGFDDECDMVAELCGLRRLPDEVTLCGGYVGKVELVDYVTWSDSPWFLGPVGWKVEGAQPWPIIYRKGERGIWVVSEDEVHQICVQLEACGYFPRLEPKESGP